MNHLSIKVVSMAMPILLSCRIRLFIMIEHRNRLKRTPLIKKLEL